MCVCSLSNFYWKWMSVFLFFLSVCSLPSSTIRSWQVLFFFLVNTKSSTPVARAFSCLPTLTNTARCSNWHCVRQKKRPLQLWSKQLWHYQGACFSWMEVKWHTATETFQTVEVPGGAEVVWITPPLKTCSTLQLCLEWGKDGDQQRPPLPDRKRWSLRMSGCTWWRRKWVAAGEAFWPSWPGQRAFLWKMSSGGEKACILVFRLNRAWRLKAFLTVVLMNEWMNVEQNILWVPEFFELVEALKAFCKTWEQVFVKANMLRGPDTSCSSVPLSQSLRWELSSNQLKTEYRIMNN